MQEPAGASATHHATRWLGMALLGLLASVSLLSADSLTKAVRNGDVQKARSLLEKGRDPNRVDKYTGMSLLIRASKMGNSEMAKALIDAGADVNHRDQQGRTALMIAARDGVTQIVRDLLEHDADPNAQKPVVATEEPTGYTALIVAAYYDHLECVEALLEHGADVTIRSPRISQVHVQSPPDARGYVSYFTGPLETGKLTALEWAKERKLGRIVEVLERHSAAR